MNAHQRVTRAIGPNLCYSDLQGPKEPIEAPDFDSEIGDLMAGVDAHNLSFEAFKQCADEELYDLVPDGFCVALILAASRSTDPAMKLMAKAARKALEEHANQMLYAAWERGSKRHG